MPSGARHRAVGVALAASFIGVAPLAAAGTAAAKPEYAWQVIFQGDTAQCTSEPDRSRLNVLAGSTITFVNATGGPATLRVDGQDTGTVGADQAVPVEFRRGPVAVSMVPECGAGPDGSFGSVTVEVVAAVSTGRPSALPARSPGNGRPGQEGGILAQRRSDRGVAPGGEGAGDPLSAGSPPPGSANAAGAANPGIWVETDKVVISAPMSVARGPKGANGLLAVVAMVFVAGVSAGAIRAIRAQRASRVMLA